MEAEPASERPSRLTRLAAPFRAGARAALNLALPPLCPACRELVGGDGLCAPCWSKLSPIAPPYCERLGIPFAYDPGPGVLSMEAIADPPAYRRARAAVRYDDIARKLVHSLKYGDRLDIAGTAGRWMARAGHELLQDADALVPAPLHWRRLWARRFNQSACSPRVQPPMPAPAPCSAPEQATSMCWFLPGLWTPCARPYSETGASGAHFAMS
jgi:hypothetical protein